MAHHQFRRGFERARRRAEIIRAETQPVHAGVDVQRVGRAAVPEFDLVERVEHRNKRRRFDLANILWRRPVQHENTRRRAERAAHFQRFPARRGEECARACLRQRIGRIERTEAVAIGLHNSRCFRRGRAFLKPTPIGDNRIGIDAKARKPLRRARLCER